MDKINANVEVEQVLSPQHQSNHVAESADALIPLMPECFTLIGGGQGILVL